jgi:hypothetical protein
MRLLALYVRLPKVIHQIPFPENKTNKIIFMYSASVRAMDYNAMDDYKNSEGL